LQLILKLRDIVQEPELIESILTQATDLDKNYYKALAVHLLSFGKAGKKKIKAIYEDLIKQNQLELAVFCAQFLGDVKLLTQPMEAANYAEYLIFTQNTNLDPELIAKLVPAWEIKVRDTQAQSFRKLNVVTQ